MTRHTVLLADDHTVVLEGLRRVLEPHFEVVGAVSDGETLVSAARALNPDVIIADISMPVLSGIDAVREIRQTDLKARVVFLTMHPDVIYASEAFIAGGCGYVLKSSAGTEIVAAVYEALRGGTYVTGTLDRDLIAAQIQRMRGQPDGIRNLPPRQREVLQLIAQGRSTKEIASMLDISSRTVEFHRYRAMDTLGVRTIAELVQYAIKHGLVAL